MRTEPNCGQNNRAIEGKCKYRKKNYNESTIRQGHSFKRQNRI